MGERRVCGEREECVMREKYKIKQLCVIKECLRFNFLYTSAEKRRK